MKGIPQGKTKQRFTSALATPARLTSLLFGALVTLFVIHMNIRSSFDIAFSGISKWSLARQVHRIPTPVTVNGKQYLYGILDVVEDSEIVYEWLRRHLNLFDGLVFLDGSKTQKWRYQMRTFPHVIYSGSQKEGRPHTTDCEVREEALKMIQDRWGIDNWIMLCDVTSFYFHSPKAVVQAAEAEGADYVSWHVANIFLDQYEEKERHARVMLPGHTSHMFDLCGSDISNSKIMPKLFKNRPGLHFGRGW
eukprot:CAMPEP_0198209836 /NCGR_PEP_ID=MMETSP1445-20131203/17762_1 /TAXON_ID=36898 /ORGANISM="Pyramimonas sp., Strain CCMP2087" /LENGTH=248 /DNA_ID=CAMNT_0043883733 /DNA_START=369 /DNA_END=1112 /DNA_ORIENTATION=+